jgi:hypothetical protein
MRKTLALLLVVVTAGSVLTYFTMRHRVADDSLAHSLARAIGGPAQPEQCREAGHVWECSVADQSGPNGYRVTVRGHCWRADRRRGVAGGGGSTRSFPERVKGCIGFRDQLRAAERLTHLLS